ncbi:bromo-adjacent homology (BAH) domain-containing protein [Actinidia rufa]|uniref:Bromo-adjacent homology (BAH) domain-containing protein n=1 Tax=Actinidia rufa TaxID=165716 RepID=A0A7J0DKE3_9ERIC|nr:bromo-adjacent homology (BAH) domain-containing protein [Actinidia rufa]
MLLIRVCGYEIFEFPPCRLNAAGTLETHITVDITQKKVLDRDFTVLRRQRKEEGIGNHVIQENCSIVSTLTQFLQRLKHKCVVHFIPLNNQIPNRKQNRFGADWVHVAVYY